MEDQVLATLIANYKISTHSDSQGVSRTAERGTEASRNFILLDIRSSDLLLPFTSVRATFELQSIHLLSRMEKFVARQESPFNSRDQVYTELGIIARMSSLEQLRYNVYECVVEGMQFCEIENEQIESIVENGDEESFFRSCDAKLIYEDYDFKPEAFQQFFEEFGKIKHKNVLERAYRIVHHEHLFSQTDSVAVFYSILKLLALPNEEKYRVAITFNADIRQEFLHNFFVGLRAKNKSDLSKFLSVGSEGGMLKEGLAMLALLLALLYYFSQERVEL